MYDRETLLYIVAWTSLQLKGDEAAAKAVAEPQDPPWTFKTSKAGAAHIARSATPKHVLADIEAKREILNLYERYQPVNANDPMHAFLAELVLLFARVYADRPSWRKEWDELVPASPPTFDGWWPPRLHPV